MNDEFLHTLRKVSDLFDLNGYVTAGPNSGSAVALASSQVAMKRKLLLVTAHLDDADEIVAMLRGIGVQSAVFPALENEITKDIVAARYAILEELQTECSFEILVASVAALMQKVPAKSNVHKFVNRICVGDECSLFEIQKWLIDSGYERKETIDDSAQFAIRGGIMDVASAAGEYVRLDFFGNTVESINEVDPESLGSDLSLNEVVLVSATENDYESNIIEYISKEWVVVFEDLAEISQQSKSYFSRVFDSSMLEHIDDLQSALIRKQKSFIACVGPAENNVDVKLPIRPLSSFSTIVSEAIEELVVLSKTRTIFLTCRTAGEVSRMKELASAGQPLGRANNLFIENLFVQRGFLIGDDVAIVPSHEIFHRYELRRGGRKQKTMRQTMAHFNVDDIVVHREHGISKYLGLKRLEGQGDMEFMTLEFANSKLVHVPATHAHFVQRYIGSFKGRPELSVLGGMKWLNQKDRAKGAVVELAHEMIRVQAVRETAPGIAFPQDTEWMKEFEASFPWDETEDQLNAISSMKKDMQSPRPMDRLICGDVGFGKTEIAIRAAFKSAESGRQVAILVPTTVLAVQHERTIRKRLADYPFIVESITRFQSKSEQKEILGRVESGEVDVLIGTHRILSKDVHFNRLGLVIIDEEQRFGVEHKQRLLGFRAEADVLTLTATPIPRTLHMALLGIRDISSLETAPVDRRAVVTEIKSWDRQVIKQGIQRELARGGQVFYVHNRVSDIEEVAHEIRIMVPEAKVIVGHGQMPPRELEKVMLSFVQGNADILVSTTIIESGIDIPTANTMFINDADRFGLSDLHQLRGRVGRYKHRAYCTLLLPRKRFLTATARRRLHAIEQFSMLGSGFEIALRDLEIRGAGNLLGSEQSGHIAAVGYEMYCQLLDQAVSHLREGQNIGQVDVMIDLGEAGSIHAVYMASPIRRLAMYCRLASSTTMDSIRKIVHDLETGYGSLPIATQRLVKYHELRIVSSALHIDSIIVDDADIVIKTKNAPLLSSQLSSSGTLRSVGPQSTAGVSAMYYRYPSRFKVSALDQLHAQLVKSSCLRQSADKII